MASGEKIEACRIQYDELRPCGALGHPIPREYARSGRRRDAEPVPLRGETPVSGATPLREWLNGASPKSDPRARLPSDLAAICHPCGTTGRPKGAMHSHRALPGATAGTATMREIGIPALATNFGQIMYSSRRSDDDPIRARM
ncbi:MAG: AMP-binding protein [Burkholderiales bacterium]|nr:MAG: AMP-binding protein [Burkholderiales bacterium]